MAEITPKVSPPAPRKSTPPTPAKLSPSVPAKATPPAPAKSTPPAPNKISVAHIYQNGGDHVKGSTGRGKTKAEPVVAKDTGHSRSDTSSAPSKQTTQQVSAPITKAQSWAPACRPLYNPGSFCYRRAITQALVALPQVVRLINSTQKTRCQEGCVTCAVRHVANTYHTSTSKAQLTSAISGFDAAVKRRVAEGLPKWTANNISVQADSHEFLVYILNTMEIARCLPSATLQQHFHLARHVSWTCQECKHVSQRTDAAEWGISLPIVAGRRGAPSLQTCMDAYHEEQSLEIRCDKCRCNRHRQRKQRISTLPEVLVVHLLRFGRDRRGNVVKDHSRVDTPPMLDLGPWCVPQAQRTRYALQSMVLHDGSTQGGHYIARAGGPRGVHEFNDAREPKSLKGFFAADGMTPYVLFYARL